MYRVSGDFESEYNYKSGSNFFSKAGAQFVPEAAIGVDTPPDGLPLTLSASLLEKLQEADKPLDFSGQPLDPDSIHVNAPSNRRRILLAFSNQPCGFHLSPEPKKTRT